MARNSKKTGRPTKMTEATLGKLREAFLLGASDQEACLLADISPDTLYAYQQKNEQFSEEKKTLKLNPVLKARKTIFNNLHNPATARWYLEKQLPHEFGRQVTTPDPTKMTIADFIAASEEEHTQTTELQLVRDEIGTMPAAESGSSPASIAELIAQEERG